eukprot:TRINITY_DN46475_c0_g1_i1.p1 TRINITY_DN46475_c0_g1~~TRINITY_DN46475_c0_g1_i1.p1  ORF type:complete len:103 (-),score=25.57 TRINITY_DN46475_c0_g1_i1:99-407(-)
MLRSLVGSEMCIRDRYYDNLPNSLLSRVEAAWEGSLKSKNNATSSDARPLDARTRRAELGSKMPSDMGVPGMERDKHPPLNRPLVRTVEANSSPGGLSLIHI